MNILRHFCITGGKKARFLAEKRLDPRLIVCYTSFYLSAGRVYFRARIFSRCPACSGRQQAARAAKYYKEVPNRMAVGARVKVILRCSECKERNYFTVKNKKNTPDRLEMKKYCPRCRKYTVHNETK